MSHKICTCGSIWRRWDPHIHTPGTALNDNFGSENAWEKFLKQIETSNPPIEALGVTDYYSLENYKKACDYKKVEGRMENVQLLFPNIELRYAIGTATGSPINFHLLISPEDPHHIRETYRFLRKLTFKAGDDEYSCSLDDIIRLGEFHAQENLNDKAAFTKGANQFKVSPDQFLEKWAASPWIQKNALIAIVARSNDGSSGLQSDASLTELRRKLERSAHIVFSSNPRDREFWLGKGVDSIEKLFKIYRGRKPCLHGSDAHNPEAVGVPAHNRFTWIKGDATFESLRQACLEPELRVVVDSTPPSGAYSSQTIESVVVDNAEWFKNGQIMLNSGLVGVIGERGSGKTALLDMIAAGAFSLSPHLTNSSFVKRAREPKDLLGDVSVTLNWKDGEKKKATLQDLDYEDEYEGRSVRYLSQQFVEQLCSSQGATDALIREIERVIFTTHSQENRLGTENFQELLDIRASLGRQRRANHERVIAETGEKIAAEREKSDAIPEAKTRQSKVKIQIDEAKTELAKLVPKDAEAHAQELEKVSAVADKLRLKIEKAKRRLEALDVLTDDVKAFRKWRRESEFEDFKEKHAATYLDDSQWSAFRIDYMGDVDQVIKSAKDATENQIKSISGLSLRSEIDADNSGVKNIGEPVISAKSFLPANTSPTEHSLSLLEKEEMRLRRLFSDNEEKRKAHKRLIERIAMFRLKVKNFNKIIKDSGSTKQQIKKLIYTRNRSYQGVFEGIEAEEEALTSLYSPLSERLSEAAGALGKLTFSIRRNVDLEAWTEIGESLLDLRRAGGFKGHGALYTAVEESLSEAWRTGSAGEVAVAMEKFRHENHKNLLDCAPVATTDKVRYQAWLVEVSGWLYSTDHIRVSYSIQHEGVDIETLSPGTRGIVLLLLYLAVDTDDDRPLIIDQPEENLDPKSVFDELVGLFRKAKQHRQIIIVTHNANLIVNTDADQVVVAECSQLSPGKLPVFEYTCGSLEDQSIRSLVCSILEGGEEAFRERAKRLRLDVANT